MNSAAETCLNLLIVGMIVACSGAFLGQAIGLKFQGMILSGLGVIILCLACFWYGAIGLVHSMSWAEFTHIEDGKRDVYVSLCLGKFHYRIKLPEKKIEK